MEIKLLIDDKEKTFVSNFISARLLRRTLEISKQVNFNDMSPEELDTMVDFIVEIFKSKFTRDDVYDGIASKELIPTITKCINEIVGEVAIATGVDEKND
ncbi:MAG: hypothetical protein WAO56_01315 [Miniphocaeibacter sp.]|jgi:hypothetical protein|uniref:phage tail assembly chaperone G n=1 Tax=Miniphocaeibacter sp. TaxID=3100973 RepID=UPI003BB1D002